MRGAIERSREIAEQTGAFATSQFENPDNCETHRTWTGPEILSQIPGGRVDGLASGVGTGGTIVGLHEAFADAGGDVVPFVARPVAGRVIREVECCSFSARIPGVVEGMSRLYSKETLPNAVEIEVDDDEALEATRRLMARGFPVGPSSGLNFVAALEGARSLGDDPRVVTVFPDRMERYFSTELFRRRE